MKVWITADKDGDKRLFVSKPRRRKLNVFGTVT